MDSNGYDISNYTDIPRGAAQAWVGAMLLLTRRSFFCAVTKAPCLNWREPMCQISASGKLSASISNFLSSGSTFSAKSFNESSTCF